MPAGIVLLPLKAGIGAPPKAQTAGGSAKRIGQDGPARALYAREKIKVVGCILRLSGMSSASLSASCKGVCIPGAVCRQSAEQGLPPLDLFPSYSSPLLFFVF